MAVGDKIFIADKPTLDTVKSNTETIKTDTDSIKTSVSNINDQVSTILNEVSDLDASITDVSKLVYTNTSISSTTPSYTDRLNIQGSGKLYISVILALGSPNPDVPNNVGMQIIADGVVVANISKSMGYNSLSEYLGYACRQSILGVETDGEILTMIGVALSKTFRPMSNSNSSGSLISINPIKFNSSLVIRSYNTGNSSQIYYYYELD